MSICVELSCLCMRLYWCVGRGVLVCGVLVGCVVCFVVCGVCVSLVS